MEDYTADLPSNQDFLRAIFGEDWKTAHVTSFPDDPSDIEAKRRGICWGGRYIGDYPLLAGNQYFTISRFTPDNGKAVRRKENFVACYVIVADDVVEKLPIELVEKLPTPSYKLRTSAGSEQWGWILIKPCRESVKVDNLLDGLVKLGLAPDGKDPGMRGVTRYVRLPDGYNSKKSRLIDGKPFDCELLEFNQFEFFTMEELAEPFGIDLHAKRKETVTGAANVDHPILDVVHVKKEKSPGRYDITCPWVEGHTDAADDGTAIWTNKDFSIGFKCHHGSCGDRTGKELLEWIEENHPGWFKRLDEWKLLKDLEVDKDFDDIEAPEPTASDSKIPPMEQILEESLLKLDGLSSSKEKKEQAFKILKIADKVNRADQINAHQEVRKSLKWSEKDLKAVLKEQRSIWYPKKDTDDTSEHHQQLDFNQFPHKKILESGVRLYDSMANTEHLLKTYKITARWDQIKKRDVLFVPGDDRTKSADVIEIIIGLFRLNELPQINTVNRIASIAHDNPINRVVEHLVGLDYKGTDYIQQLAEHITVEMGTEHIRDKVLKMWMIMACAAADYAESTPNKEAVEKFDSVMIFVGEQGIEKTKFLRAMLPKPLRRYFNDGVMIDPTDKDSISECIRWWVVEAGEVDGLFKKIDITRFKQFFSRSIDSFRKPYERSEREYERRTVFVASTNEREFLKDYTGNRRYWPLAVEGLTIPRDENLLDKAWAEAWQCYINGEQWWPDAEFKKILSEQTRSFQMPITDEPVDEAIKAMIETKFGLFSSDVVKPDDIRKSLDSSGLNGHNIRKIPSITMIGRIMKQHQLGVSFRTKKNTYWIIRNFEKYEKMKNSDIEKCYKSSLKGG